MTNLRFLPLLALLSVPAAAAPTQTPLASVPATAQQEPTSLAEKVPIALTATLAKDSFGADEHINLVVTLSNTSDKAVWLGRQDNQLSSFEMSVVRMVPSRLGRPADGGRRYESITPTSLTYLGRATFATMRSPAPFGRGFYDVMLPPQGKQTLIFPLDRLFDLTEGGSFGINLCRVFMLDEQAHTMPQPGQQTRPNGNVFQREVKTLPLIHFSVTAPVVESQITPTPVLPEHNFEF